MARGATIVHRQAKRMSTSPVWLLLPLLCRAIAGQQLVYARDQRSLYGPSAFEWNTVGSFNPIGLGHMTKDELLTLLEAWQDVESDTATPEPEPAETPATKRPAPAPPRPPPPPAPEPEPEPAPTPAPGTPVTVQLPAFVPIQLSAMFTQPAGQGAGAGAGGGAVDPVAIFNADGGASELDMMAQSNEESAMPRIFRFSPHPIMTAQPRSRPAQLPVVRNTLESVDAGVAPLANLVKAKSINTSTNTSAKTPPVKVKAPPQPKEVPFRRGPPLRPRFPLPPLPYLANAPGRLELVPSSQIIGDWRE